MKKELETVIYYKGSPVVTTVDIPWYQFAAEKIIDAAPVAHTIYNMVADLELVIGVSRRGVRFSVGKLK